MGVGHQLAVHDNPAAFTALQTLIRPALIPLIPHILSAVELIICNISEADLFGAIDFKSQKRLATIGVAIEVHCKLP